MLLISCERKEAVQSRGVNVIDKISNDTEISFGDTVKLEEFFERNPEFNPSWFAKLNLTPLHLAELEAELQRKPLVKMLRSSSPADIVPWWVPLEEAPEFTYMTSSSAPVNIVISSGNGGGEVFVWWSSP